MVYNEAKLTLNLTNYFFAAKLYRQHLTGEIFVEIY